jgi:hypothetical protein
MNYPQQADEYRSKRVLSEIVEWVEAHSADTHRGE